MFSWIVCIALAVFFLVQHRFSYWKRRGIAQLAPTFPFGNFRQLFRQKLCLGAAFADLYEQCKHLPCVGVYLSFRPILLINDPELIKIVLVRDFDHFNDHGIHVNEERDPLSGHLFALSGEKWRHLRTQLNPAFSSSRLRDMFPNLIQVGRALQDHLEKRASKEVVVDIRDLSARYTTDIIASVGFGIENDSINESDNAFRKMGSKFFETSLRNILRLAATLFTPKLKELLRFKFLQQELEDFMMNVVRETIEYRETNNVVRKDVMQLLMQLRNTGSVSNDERWDAGVSSSKDHKLSLGQVTAHALVFFIAGFETASTTIAFCLLELAQNEKIQRKLQAEIDHVLAVHNGQTTYESINEMRYLDNCIDETLRKYPAFPFLNRECTKDYTIPGTTSVIEKGTSIIVPLLGLHHDPDYYKQPDRFIPERFADAEAMADKPYLPFGSGPRICIGVRLGKLEAKIALLMILSKFDVRPVDDAHRDRKLSMNAKCVILTPVGRMEVLLTTRQQ